MSAVNIDNITVLHSNGTRLCKRIRKDGSVEPYGSAKNFRVEEVTVSSVRDAHTLLQKIENDSHSCIIRGHYIGDKLAAPIIAELPDNDRPTQDHTFRRKVFFNDQPLHLVMFDIENITTKTDALVNPQGAILECIKERFRPEFHGVSFSWQLSNSAGIKPGLRAHVWFWFKEPRTSAALKAWAEGLKVPVDVSVFDPVQIHYTSAPEFEQGAKNPVKQRSGIYSGLKSDEVDISIPEVESGSATVSDRATNPIELRTAIDDAELVRLRSALTHPKLLDAALTNDVLAKLGYALITLGELGRNLFIEFCAHMENYEQGWPEAWWTSHADQPTRTDYTAIFTMVHSLGWIELTFDDNENVPIYGTSKVELTRGDKIKLKNIDWLMVDSLARGKIQLFAGRPGCAKSTIAFNIAAILSVGGDWPDGTAAPKGSTIVFSGEDSPEDTIIPRYLAAGGDPTKIHIISSITEDGVKRAFDPATDMVKIEEAAANIPDLTLLIVDPIVSAVAGDSHKNAETRRGLQPLDNLAYNRNLAVIGISHFTKGTSGGDPTERVTGSLAFGALPRIIWAVAKMQDSTERIFVRAKSNIGPDGGGFKYSTALLPVPGHPELNPASVIVWGEQLDGSAQDLLKEAESGTTSKKDQACNVIPELLAANGGKMPAKDLYEALDDIGRDNVRKAIKMLKLVQTKPDGARGKMVYQMPAPDESITSLFDIDEPMPKLSPNWDLVGDQPGDSVSAPTGDGT